MFHSSSLIRMLFCGLLPCAIGLWGGAAHGQDIGVLVRLEPGGQPVTAAPEIRLAPLSGEPPILLTLNDDGSAPDVVAGDGRWAGVAMTPITAFNVSVSVGADTMDAGEVAWPENVSTRDLVLTLRWGGVTAEAASPENPTGAGRQAKIQGAGSSTTNSTSNATNGAGTSANPDASARARTAAAPVGGPVASPTSPGAETATWVWLALGIGALALLGGLNLLFRERPAAVPSVQLDRASEPPLFGPGSPSVHVGLSTWQVDWASRAEFLDGFLASLARHHRVLYVVSPGERVPAVFGGPVYICHQTDLRRFERHLEDVLAEPGLPLVVLFVEPDPSAKRVQALTELLSTDVGGVLLTSTPPAGQSGVVSVRVQTGGAVVTTSAATIELELGRFGYAPRS